MEADFAAEFHDKFGDTRKKWELTREDNLILLVYKGVNLTQEQLANVPAQVLHFKNKPVLKDVTALVK